jgi:hypothetical protein
MSTLKIVGNVTAQYIVESGGTTSGSVSVRPSTLKFKYLNTNYLQVLGGSTTGVKGTRTLKLQQGFTPLQNGITVNGSAW